MAAGCSRSAAPHPLQSYALLDKHTKPWKIDYAFQCPMIDAFHVRRTCIHTLPYDDDPKVNVW